jgi:hypothetical protein
MANLYGPVEESVNGWVKFTYPVIYQGQVVEGVELKFENGRVVSAKAEVGEAFLQTMIDSDAGSHYLGEFAIGTNYEINRFTRNILFDEKLGGTFHLALGAGYPETGSRNTSTIHWDMICDMRNDSEMSVVGVVFYRNGNSSNLIDNHTKDRISILCVLKQGNPICEREIIFKGCLAPSSIIPGLPGLAELAGPCDLWWQDYRRIGFHTIQIEHGFRHLYVSKLCR